MTITSADLRVEATGDGATLPFTFTMPVASISDIVVIRTVIATGVETIEVEGSTINTTLSGTPPGATGGTVTFVSAPASTERVTIHLNSEMTQRTILPLSGPFLSTAVEAALDKVTNIAKRSRDLAIRSITLKDGASSGSGEMDAKSNRIANVADGVNANDAVNMSQVTSANVNVWRFVASATALPIQSTDRVVNVTGVTNVSSITGGVLGQMLTLIWYAGAVFDVSNGSGIELNGGVDITTATANSTLSLYFDGTNWLEMGRSIT